VSDVRAASPAGRLGTEGGGGAERSWGEEIERFRRRRAPERLILALPIDPPVAETESLRFILHRLAGALAAQIDARGMAAARATLRLTLEMAFARAGTPEALVVAQGFP